MKNLGSFAGNKFFIVFQFARLTVKTHRAMDLASPLENGFVWVCLAHRGDRIAPIFAVLSHDFGGLKHVTSFDFDNFSGLWMKITTAKQIEAVRLLNSRGRQPREPRRREASWISPPVGSPVGSPVGT